MMIVDLLIFFAFIMILFSYFQGRVIFCVSPEIAVMQGTTLCAGENREMSFPTHFAVALLGSWVAIEISRIALHSCFARCFDGLSTTHWITSLINQSQRSCNKKKQSGTSFNNNQKKNLTIYI